MGADDERNAGVTGAMAPHCIVESASYDRQDNGATVPVLEQGPKTLG